MPHRVRVEVCVTSVAEALAAERAGAETIEVCQWLACGGTTPSFGLLNLLQERVRVRKRVLVRPVPGGFSYSADERQVLLRDAMMSGVGDPGCGIVTGGLDEHGLPDVELWKAVRLAAADRELTFHRAVDTVPDPLRAFEVLLLMDVQRVLSSGGQRAAMEGRQVLAEMVRRAGEGVVVAAAAGIGPDNVVAIVEDTGVREVHFSAQIPNADGSFAPDEARIAGVMEALSKAGLR